MVEVKDLEVYLVSKPQVNTREMVRYLQDVGGDAWVHKMMQLEDVPEAEGLIEFMGRLCYKSWAPGLNPNVTRVRDDRLEYLLNILRSGHGSVLEHAVFGFAIRDVSRVVTHELVRHRVGTAISQESLRYVRLDDLRFRVPPGLKPRTEALMLSLVYRAEDFLRDMIESEGLNDPGMDFAEKKRITSALRRVVPMGIATEMGWSANVRTIRHVIETRSDEHAEEEIRVFARQLGEIMVEECPLLFGDYEEDEGGTWRTEFGGV